MRATFVATTRMHFHDIGELTLPDETVPALRCRSSKDYPDTIALNEFIYWTAVQEHNIEYVIFEDGANLNRALLSREQVEKKMRNHDTIRMPDDQRLFIFYWSELDPNAKGTTYEFADPRRKREPVTHYANPRRGR